MTIDKQLDFQQNTFERNNKFTLQTKSEPIAKPVARIGSTLTSLILLSITLLNLVPAVRAAQLNLAPVVKTAQFKPVPVVKAALPIGPNNPAEPEPVIPDKYLPPSPPKYIKVIEREEMLIELSWYDSSQYEDGYQLQRRVPRNNSRWTTLNSWGSQTGTIGYTDNNVQPDTEYCYRVRVYNTRGTRYSPQKCIYSRDGNDFKVWRAQITFNTASRSDADTDDSVFVRLNAGNNNFIPSGNQTWLDYGRDDFERGDTFTYDLNVKNVSEMADIIQLNISKLGSNGWCITDFTLTVNGLDVYDEDFSGLADGCLWLDNDNGHSRTHVVTHEMLRTHPDWDNYNHTTALFLLGVNGIPNEEMASRLEGMTGDFIHNNKLYWGHIHGPAVEITRGCPANVESCQTIHVDFDLAASVFGPNPGVDMDFDLNLECSDGDLNITSSNVEIDVDSKWYWEVLSFGLINFIDGKVEDRISNSWEAIEEMLEVGADCQIHVNEYGDIFIESVKSAKPVISIPTKLTVIPNQPKAKIGRLTITQQIRKPILKN